MLSQGVICKGRQIFIPETLKDDIKQQLHEGHQGIEKTRRLARDTVHWVGINKDIEKLCKSCQICQKYQDEHKREPLLPHPTASRPWQSISSDLFSIGPRSYLLIVDRYSKYPLLDEFSTIPTSTTVADATRHYCGMFGRPDNIVSDNGTQYTGSAYQFFVKEWGIKHKTSSPCYPRSNGLAERHVGHIKSLIRKSIQSGQDLQAVLMNIRATPIDSHQPSPAELMFGRPLVTKLPNRGQPGCEDVRERQEQLRDEMKKITIVIV